MACAGVVTLMGLAVSHPTVVISTITGVWLPRTTALTMLWLQALSSYISTIV